MFSSNKLYTPIYISRKILYKKWFLIKTKILYRKKIPD
jgi:hypothetical protein